MPAEGERVEAGRLVVVSNSTSSATAYTSDDGWNSAALVGESTFTGQATTGAVVDDDVYVVQPHFNDAEPPVILASRIGQRARRSSASSSETLLTLGRLDIWGWSQKARTDS